MMLLRAALAVLMLAFGPIGALAADSPWMPDRPIRLVVAFPPGGPNDLMARMLGPRIAEALKQPVVVENRGGSNGEIAAAAIAKLPADGQTLLFVSNGAIVISPSLGRKLGYDPVRDLAPIMLIADSPMLLVVNTDVPASNVDELIRLIRAQPGRLNYASASTGSATHLAAELFKSMAKLDVVHVPYKGGGPALTDVMAGQVQYYFGGLTTALPYVKAGRMRGLAVTGPSRSAAAPGIPSLSETLPGYAASLWYALMTTAGTPRPIISRYYEVIASALREPEVRAKLVELGADPLDLNPERFSAFIREDTDKWTRIVRAAGIKPE